MTHTVAKPQPASPRESLADVRGVAVKADLKAQVGASPLREVAASALQNVTQQNAAAIDLGIHEGRLSHKLRDGSLTLAQLEKLGHVYAAEFGRQLVEIHAPLLSPAARIRFAIREARRRLDDVEQYLEFLT